MDTRMGAASLDPSTDEIDSGCYVVMYASDVTEMIHCDDEIGWNNIREFRKAVKS